MAVVAVKYINTIDIVCLVSLRNLRSLVIIFPYLTKFSNLPKFPNILQRAEVLPAHRDYPALSHPDLLTLANLIDI